MVSFLVTFLTLLPLVFSTRKYSPRETVLGLERSSDSRDDYDGLGMCRSHRSWRCRHRWWYSSPKNCGDKNSDCYCYGSKCVENEVCSVSNGCNSNKDCRSNEYCVKNHCCSDSSSDSSSDNRKNGRCLKVCPDPPRKVTPSPTENCCPDKVSFLCSCDCPFDPDFPALFAEICKIDLCALSNDLKLCTNDGNECALSTTEIKTCLDDGGYTEIVQSICDDHCTIVYDDPIIDPAYLPTTSPFYIPTPEPTTLEPTPEPTQEPTTEPTFMTNEPTVS